MYTDLYKKVLIVRVISTFMITSNSLATHKKAMRAENKKTESAAKKELQLHLQ